MPRKRAKRAKNTKHKRQTTNDQLCAALKVDARTIYTWREQGLPHERRSNRLYYNIEEVQAWLDAKGLTTHQGPRRAYYQKVDKLKSLPDGPKPGQSPINGQPGPVVAETPDAAPDAMAETNGAMTPESIALKHELAKYRKDEAAATKAELELAIRRGEYLPVELVREHWRTIAHKARAKALAMPQRLAGKLARIKDTRKVRGILETAVYDLLNEFRDTLQG